MLRQLDDDLWVADHDFRMGGLAIGARTSVVKLEDGGLFLHAPGPLDARLAKELDALGPVRCIVAPNCFHHLFVADNAKVYQAASVYLAPGLSQKRKDLSFNEELSDEPPAVWAADLDQLCVKGWPTFNEVVFLHRRSRSLILTDLAFNIAYSPSLLTRLFFRLNSAYGRFTPSRLVKLTLRDRVAARASIEEISSWDFDRVIVSHGEILEKGGAQAFRDAFAWLLA